MKLEVTELGPLKRAVTIEVPAEDVAKRFQDAYADLKRQVRIPGFRPGKAPLAILEKRYAKAVQDDVVRQLIPDYYQRAMKETGFSPVAVDIPPLEHITIKKGEPLVFTTTVEIKPTVEPREYRGITLAPDTRTVAEEDVEHAMQILRRQHATLEAVQEERGIAEGDYVQVRIEDNTHWVRVGDKTPLQGIVLDEALLGKQKGAVVEVAGETLTIRGVVQEIKTKVLPELDDEFAKDLGEYQTLAELREKVRAQLERDLQRDIEGHYKDLCMKRLVETHQFEVPESLLQREVDAMVRQAQERQRRLTWATTHGASPSDQSAGQPALDPSSLRDEFLPRAKERVKLGLILDAIAKQEEMTVAEADIEQECRRMARALNVEAAEVKQLVMAGGQDAIEDFRSRILAEKTMQFVYEKAIIQTA